MSSSTSLFDTLKAQTHQLGQALRKHPWLAVLCLGVSLSSGCFLCVYFGATLLMLAIWWGIQSQEKQVSN